MLYGFGTIAAMVHPPSPYADADAAGLDPVRDARADATGEFSIHDENRSYPGWDM
jgi:hypothetical protein